MTEPLKTRELVEVYYQALEERHYKPMKYFARDARKAKEFLATGRTIEDFKKLLHKALVGPKELQIAACGGLHRFMYHLAEIELLDEAPWEPSPEERAVNIRLVETCIASIASQTKTEKPMSFAEKRQAFLRGK